MHIVVVMVGPGIAYGSGYGWYCMWLWLVLHMIVVMVGIACGSAYGWYCIWRGLLIAKRIIGHTHF